MNIYEIDGVKIKPPNKCQVTLTDLETSADRSASGVLARVRAREGVRKVSMSFSGLRQEEVSFLIKKMKAESFKLKYYDPEYGIHEITCYCSTKDTDLCRVLLDGTSGLWSGLSFNCIEI